MTGESYAHQRIGFNLMAALLARIDRQRFTVVQEMRLRIGRSVRYPDVSVMPGRVGQAVKTLDDAVALFEVLSDETSATDLLDKLDEYASAASFRHYVVVEQSRHLVLVHSRQDHGTVRERFADGVIPLPGIDVELPFAAIYEDLTFDGPTA
ncbi:MAG: Uma2 family endonuclease [Acidisphaera sp.]|nr:Uma2 family endonuclease [Acidisphaera sp.]